MILRSFRGCRGVRLIGHVYWWHSSDCRMRWHR